MVPFILITTVAIALVLLTEDTPTGKWADRAGAVSAAPHTHASVVPTTGFLTDQPTTTGSISSNDEKKKPMTPTDIESASGDVQVIDEFQHEVVVKPTLKEGLKVMFSLQTAMLCAGYFCSFGGELAINSVLGAYYLKNFSYLGQTNSGRWAAMFGLLNVITRPLGGFIGDLIYRVTNGNLWAKKLWINFVGVMSGVFLIIIGRLNPHKLDEMIGLIAVMAIFLEAGNGANFALVPHIHPHANGKPNSLFPQSHDYILTIDRHPLWNCRRNWKLWRHCICHHLPLPQDQLRASVLDHGYNYYLHEPHFHLGQAHS